MARIEIEITNNRNQESVEIPHLFGGYEVDPNSTTTIEADSQRFDRLEHNDDPDALIALEALENETDVTVDIRPVVTLEQENLEEKLEAAQAFGALAGRQIRIGTGTFTSGGGTTQTFQLSPGMPDGDYEVITTFTGDYSASTTANAQNPRVTSKAADEFDLTMNEQPAADADFAFAVIANPSNPS